MTPLEQVLKEHRKAIEELQIRNEAFAEALASHASVIRLMAMQIKDIAQHLDVDVEPKRMM